ncbi:hypothetical protein [Streptomyces sp. NPDC051561]|uniref:hypothetical protein n=1 Tax=Streptomyces sp. NPDC051561 TaxID=3365658 RepID=UPI00378F5BD6
MAASIGVPRMCRVCRLADALPLSVVRAGLFAVIGTAFAVAAHHVVFDDAPSWMTRGLAMLALFGCALVRGSEPTSLKKQLAAAATAQAVLAAWFMYAADDSAASALHDAKSLLLMYMVATLLTAWPLHAVDRGVARVISAAGNEFELLREYVHRLVQPLRPVATSEPVVARPRFVRWDRPPAPSALLADALIRRGLPFALPRAAV